MKGEWSDHYTPSPLTPLTQVRVECRKLSHYYIEGVCYTQSDSTVSGDSTGLFLFIITVLTFEMYSKHGIIFSDYIISRSKVKSKWEAATVMTGMTLQLDNRAIEFT